MGVLSNTVNMCQFKVDLKEGAAIMTLDSFQEHLANKAFVGIENTTDEESAGWVNLFDSAKTSFDDLTTLQIGDFLAFSLRQDRRKIPAAVLKEKIANIEAKYLQENPNFRRVPKNKREEIKEQVKFVLLAKTLPVPAVHDIVWNQKTSILTFFNLSTKGIDLFDTMFRKTFPEYSLRLITPYDRALAVADHDSIFSAKVLAANQANSDSILALIRDNSWLGNDFFLWLLHGTSEGVLDLAENLVVYINDRLALISNDETGQQKIAFSGDQSKLAAVKAALSGGKLISMARIFMEVEENTWSFTLKGDRFDFASYKCPAVHIEREIEDDGVNEQQAVFLERMFLLQQGLDKFHSIFANFLTSRLGPGWPAEVETIKEWLTE